MGNIGVKLKNNISFWERNSSSALKGYSIGNYFISKRYRAAAKLLCGDSKIEPVDIKVNEFREDYLRMYEQWEQVNDQVFFTGTPFPGLPWMEAILGCDVYSTDCSFIAKSTCNEIDCINVERIINKDWLEKYIEFTIMLNELGRDKFPVGQPIMRGPTDIAGTLIGQDKLIYHFYDNPEQVLRIMSDSVEVFLNVISEQRKYIDKFCDGYAMGFYDLWCPGDCIWYQDDLNALLSPKLYENFVYDLHKRICKSYEYTMIHLHPASFYIIDYLLDIDELKAIQINKDVGGPSVCDMLPILKRVQEKKNLVLWGDFDNDELSFINNNIDPEGLYVIVFKEKI